MENLLTLLKHFKWNLKEEKLKIDKLNHVRPDEKLLKSLKDRFNYASSTCSARILSTSPSTLSPSSLLSPNKDSYLQFQCSQSSKFVVVELCEEVKVDAIVLANYELFSATIRGFKVYGAADKLAENAQVIWKLLLSGEILQEGPFLHADQAFPIAKLTDSFIKYLRIEFDEDRHGHEDLCPVSVLKVYGKTMLDEFTEELKVKVKEENLPIYSDELVLSPELKILIEEMSKISSKLSQEEILLSFFQSKNLNSLFNPISNEKGQVIQELKEKYVDLERKSFAIQTQSKTSGNVFKNLHDRLNKLESSLKHPLNLILFRSRRHEETTDDQIPRLLANQADKSVEELFSSLNEEIFDLNQNLKRIQSHLSSQQTKITVLLAFNSLLLCILLISLLKKLFIKSTNKTSPNPELRRRPLLELKSTSNLSSSSPIATKSMCSLQSTPSPKPPTPNTPGVVLSDDEVLLLDESICEQ